MVASSLEKLNLKIVDSIKDLTFKVVILTTSEFLIQILSYGRDLESLDYLQKQDMDIV